jgi:hypothetical protein
MGQYLCEECFKLFHDLAKYKRHINNSCESDNELTDFGKDGIDSLQTKEVNNIINTKLDMLLVMITKVNFDPNKPQHHNIYVSDYNGEYAKVYEKKKWVTKRLDDIVDIVIDSKKGDLFGLINVFDADINEKSIRNVEKTVASDMYLNNSKREQIKYNLYDGRTLV